MPLYLLAAPLLSLSLGLAAALPGQDAAQVSPEPPRAEVHPIPTLEVLGGDLDVFAGETWYRLAAGACLPRPQALLRLRLSADTRARLSLAGAGVQIRGPLELDSNAAQTWALRLMGSGSVQLEARSTRLQVELPGAAWVEVGSTVAWIQGQPDGSWRVGCDAGDTLRLRPPPGARWDGAASLAPGAVLRVVPTSFVPPPSARGIRGGVVEAWGSFSWPWPS